MFDFCVTRLDFSRPQYSIASIFTIRLEYFYFHLLPPWGLMIESFYKWLPKQSKVTADSVEYLAWDSRSGQIVV